MTACPTCAQLERAIAIAARRDRWEAYDLRVQLADHQGEHAQDDSDGQKEVSYERNELDEA